MLKTARLDLLPYAPQQLLVLIEEPQRFADLVGLPAAEGLREFLVSDDVSPTFAERLRSAHDPNPWVHGFAVVHREERCVIGSASFKGPPDADGTVEIAYGIVPRFEGHGYATAASNALIAFALRDKRVDLVRAHTLPTQNASTRVLVKCGFDCVGEVEDPDDRRVWRWELRRSPTE